jgi:Fur family transcriptional regulator, zinc uptake regulator
LAHRHDHSHGAHDHHHHDAVAAAEAHCEVHGLKLTDLRRQVFEALANTGRALGAYDIIEVLAEKGTRRLAPVSVYRALDFLMEAGLAHRIASRNAFVACPHRHGPDELVVFMICESCGRIEEGTSDSVSRALASVAQTRHFVPRGQVVEMHGRCAGCSDGSVMTA